MPEHHTSSHFYSLDPETRNAILALVRPPEYVPGLNEAMDDTYAQLAYNMAWHYLNHDNGPEHDLVVYTVNEKKYELLRKERPSTRVQAGEAIQGELFDKGWRR